MDIAMENVTRSLAKADSYCRLHIKYFFSLPFRRFSQQTRKCPSHLHVLSKTVAQLKGPNVAEVLLYVQ